MMLVVELLSNEDEVASFTMAFIGILPKVTSCLHIYSLISKHDSISCKPHFLKHQAAERVRCLTHIQGMGGTKSDYWSRTGGYVCWFCHSFPQLLLDKCQQNILNTDCSTFSTITSNGMHKIILSSYICRSLLCFYLFTYKMQQSSHTLFLILSDKLAKFVK
jgi:hypothetical protein